MRSWMTVSGTMNAVSYEQWPSTVCHVELAETLFGMEEGRALVRAWFDAQLDRVTDPSFAAPFCQHMALPGRQPAEFNHRIVEAAGLRVLGGIRFFGGDRRRPFVELMAWAKIGASNLTATDWSTLHRLIADEWRAFQPLAIRIFLPALVELPPGAHVDMTVHVASYGEIMLRARGSSAPVHLIPLKDIDAALRLVERRYKQIAITDQALARNIAPVSRQELEESAADQRAFAIMEAGQMAGVLATLAGSIEWLEGDVVLEEAVAFSHSGRGLAASAQRALAARMAHQPDRLLIGTIDSRNVSSRTTAENAGRPAVLRYAFLPLPC
jgi:hypothetical protein